MSAHPKKLKLTDLLRCDIIQSNFKINMISSREVEGPAL
jgi:hypothetical protein